ncbi:hypothetical protein [Sulfurisoma sediminicola]|uniref:Uncharacterized protein n=1 Tax=Sulfurisoma sediminicola TaxID=1381557 RepID=A0A497XCE9_9PROT|nr:hypothetical protein [Sulfurisoma sediminicola]RLJ64600.1 hypothetical protein DFR35_1241 [Sulfurisoma sediminicola]
MSKEKTEHEHVALPSNIADLFAAGQAALEAGKLDDWDKDFLTKNAARYEKWGDETYLSAKQIEILTRIAGKAIEATDEAA